MDFTKAGKKIRKKRLALKITQIQLAEKVGLCNDYISKIERGERVPKLPCLIKILNALGLSADEVLFDQVNNGYEGRMLKYAERIGTMPIKKQNWIFKMLDQFFDRVFAEK